MKLTPGAYGYVYDPVWFPLASALDKSWELNPDEVVPRIESFQVAVDGNPIDFDVSEWPNPKGADKPPLPWASFPVTFPADKETAIQVSYVLPLPSGVQLSPLNQPQRRCPSLRRSLSLH